MAHTEERALKQLSKKRDCRVYGKRIVVLSNNSKERHNDLGNKSWGKIDYLVKAHDYILYRVPDFSKLTLKSLGIFG